MLMSLPHCSAPHLTLQQPLHTYTQPLTHRVVASLDVPKICNLRKKNLFLHGDAKAYQCRNTCCVCFGVSYLAVWAEQQQQTHSWEDFKLALVMPHCCTRRQIS